MTSYTLVLNEIAQKLQEIKGMLVTAESCTGGLIASSVTEVPGSSLWFERGFVTYSNLSKQQMLGVPEELITKFGAVSEEVALAMAEGALNHSSGTIAVSVTGIAGPDGGSAEKPVGLVCLGWAAHGMKTKTLKIQFIGSRQEVRSASVYQALTGILTIIK